MFFKDKKLEKSIHDLLDIFTGSDGGVQFLIIQRTLEVIEQRALDGDEASKKIIQEVKKASKLFNILGSNNY